MTRGGPRSPDPFATWLGLRWDDARTTRLTIRPELLNSGGLLLGPVGFALVDYSMGSTLWETTSEDEHIATTSISLNYVQSASAGDVTCRSQLDRRNRTTGHLRSELRTADRLLATAIGSFAIFPAATLDRRS